MSKLYFSFFIIVFLSCKGYIDDKSSANASFFDFNLFGNGAIEIDSTIINNHKNPLLKAFYINYNYQTAWQNKEHRDFILNEIQNAENEGLNPLDYNYNKLKSFEEKYESLKDSTLIDYDFLLTTSTQLYIKHNSQGKLNPNELYDDWDLAKKTIDINAILYDCLDNNNFANAIENCKPNHFVYKKLKKSLQILNQLPDEYIGFVDLKEKILPFKSNKYVPTIKKRLLFWGDMKGKDSLLTTIYDLKTQEAVKIFQARHGLKPDGVIGKGTIEALNHSKIQRINQVIANMERWKWYAKDLGKHYLLINIPDYSLVAIKENTITQTQRVVVGKDSRKTPILESKISNINLNPNWTVPPTILAEDIYPSAIKNKNTFKRKGLTILNYKNKEINPSQWKMEDAKKYHYVQNPSRNNALGSMKINFPNKYAVYLHDTNHRDYFVKTYRALSSGCVRLEKPLEMAAYILNDTTKWSLKTIQDTTDIKHYFKLKKEKENEIALKNAKLLAKNPTMVIAKKVLPNPQLKTITVKVPEDIYVHQLYWTAWEDNGILQFREDIYCLDFDLFTKLRY